MLQGDVIMSPGTHTVTMAEELDKGRRDKGRLWGTRKQRELWLADVGGAHTVSRVAFCCGWLGNVAASFEM